MGENASKPEDKRGAEAQKPQKAGKKSDPMGAKVPSGEEQLGETGLGSSSGGRVGSGAKGSSKRSGGAEGQPKLLDFYTVGDEIGQGSFGVVYACKPKSGDKERSCAVKMVDRVETPVDKILEEVEFMRRMDHPNVIKCYDVFYEKCFICIVMDRLLLDLITGMGLHWENVGKIPVQVTRCIAAQMGASIHYLHRNNVIHRDIKGDNYLIDREDITDPVMRVVLIDFGTSKLLSPAERLKEKCGTQLYWSPEFWDMDYSLKADIWAMGVVLYGLICSRFPFRNESQAKTKKLKFSADVPEVCIDLAMKVLAKSESDRASAAEFVAHPMVADKSVEAPKSEGYVGDAPQNDEEKDEVATKKEIGADRGVQERRNELVERFVKAGTPHSVMTRNSTTKLSGDAIEGPHVWEESFGILDARQENSTFMYEWKTQDAVYGSEVDVSVRHPTSPSHEGDTKNVIRKQLEDHGIDTTAFGKGDAKTLMQLAEEVEAGSSLLMLDATECKKLVRVVDVVALRVCAPQSDTDSAPKYLIELGEKFPDGRERNIHRLPGTKRNPQENAKQSAQRVVTNYLGPVSECEIKWDFCATEFFEDEQSSPSFPGVRTVYRKEIIEGVITKPSASMTKECFVTGYEWNHQGKDLNTRTFKWMEPEQCDADAGLQYKSPQDWSFSALVQAPIGLNQDELITFLSGQKVDVSKFGQGGAKTLQQFSAELVAGASALVQEDGEILRVVDSVLLKLINTETNKVLVLSDQKYPDGRSVVLNSLPNTTRRPDENYFLSARRILHKQLKVDTSYVTLDAENIEDVDNIVALPEYPGVRTLHRRKTVTAYLSPMDVH